MHLKRFAMPKTWPLARKTEKYVTVPNRGRHKLDEGMGITNILRDMLHVTRTAREADKLLHTKQIFVNGVVCTDHRFPVGLFDVISFGDSHYRLQLHKTGVFIIKQISAAHASKIYCKIKGKRAITGGKIQLTLSEGSNLIAPDKEKYHVGDTVILNKGKIAEVLPFEKGCLIYLTGGRYVSNMGVLRDIKHFTGGEDDRIVISVGHGKEEAVIETLKEYAFVVDTAFQTEL